MRRPPSLGPQNPFNPIADSTTASSSGPQPMEVDRIVNSGGKSKGKNGKGKGGRGRGWWSLGSSAFQGRGRGGKSKGRGNKGKGQGQTERQEQGQVQQWWKIQGQAEREAVGCSTV